MKKIRFSLTGNILYLFMLAACLAVTLGQGIEPLFLAPHSTKVTVILGIFFIYFCVLAVIRHTGRNYEDFCIFAIISFGILLRCSYVLLSGLYDRQHDAGAFTGMGTDFVNPGHIGYIEYIYKFNKLPQVNPYELFGYYHPPLHHIISWLWLRINLLFGATEALAFENLQILPLLYSCLCMPVTAKVLKLLRIQGTGLYIGLAFMALHPSVIVMTGSVNNDMLTMLFMCLTIYLTLKWIRQKNLPNLLLLGLVLALGMITKLNSAVIALPMALIFLMHFIGVIRSGVKPDILLWIKNYCLFGLVTGVIGLSWIVRNLVVYGEKPGVPVPGETSPMYTAPYSLWERLGLPSLADWNVAFPFHPISAKACHNTWVIMFQTSLFAEEYPTDASDFVLSLSQLTYVLAIILGVVTAILLIVVLCKKATGREDAGMEDAGMEDAGMEDAIFLLTGYVSMLVSFAAFVVIYPYTCSCDFRYVTICLLYIAIGLGLGNGYFIAPGGQTAGGNGRLNRLGAWCMHGINFGIIAVLTGTTLIYAVWDRF